MPHSVSVLLQDFFEIRTRGGYDLMHAILQFTASRLIDCEDELLILPVREQFVGVASKYEKTLGQYEAAINEEQSLNHQIFRKLKEGQTVEQSLYRQAVRLFQGERHFIVNQIFPNGMMQIQATESAIALQQWDELLLRLGIHQSMAPALVSATQYRHDLEVLHRRCQKAAEVSLRAQLHLESMRIQACEELEALLGYLRWVYKTDKKAVMRFFNFRLFTQQHECTT